MGSVVNVQPPGRVGGTAGGAVAGLRGRAGVTRSDALTWARGPWESAAQVPHPHTARRLQAPLMLPGRGHIFFPLKNNIKNASF